LLDWNCASRCLQQERLAPKTGEPRFGQWIIARQRLHHLRGFKSA
jgi:hypothetical protein